MISYIAVMISYIVVMISYIVVMISYIVVMISYIVVMISYIVVKISYIVVMISYIVVMISYIVDWIVGCSILQCSLIISLLIKANKTAQLDSSLIMLSFASLTRMHEVKKPQCLFALLSFRYKSTF